MAARLDLGGALGETYFLRYVRTYHKRPAPKMDPWEKITKKRLNNPVLWKQLDAITKGTYVNHLGRGHERTHPIGFTIQQT